MSWVKQVWVFFPRRPIVLALQTPENIKFREKVNKLMKREPTANIVYNYTGMELDHSGN